MASVARSSFYSPELQPKETQHQSQQGGEDGRENKGFLSSPLYSSGAFYATSIHWNICTASYFCKPSNIFKHAGGGDFMEEVCVEFFCNRKIVLLFKKIILDLIVSKMPGCLTYTRQRQNVWYKFVYLRVKSR